jgi:hypothetical protein
MCVRLLAAALLLTGCVHYQRQPLAFAFATGPSSSASALIDAIAVCHAPATVVTDGERAMVLLEQDRPAAAFNCLSEWVHQHPETGVGKVGFVGTEQAPEAN